MALLTRDLYKSSIKNNIRFVKTASRTTIAATWFSVFDLAGSPGAGTLAVGNTANGLVPVQGGAGFPPVNAFAAGIGEMGRIRLGSSVACKVKIMDCLFAAGAYAFNANTTLASQPSYSTRVPQGHANQTELWYEQVTVATGNPTVTCTYTDEAGNAGASTGAVAFGLAPTVGRCIQLPLASGDSGIQQLSSVVASVATVGTFNLRVLRPLWEGRIPVAGGSYTEAWVNLPRVSFQDRPALFVLVSADSTSSGIPDIDIELCNG